MIVQINIQELAREHLEAIIDLENRCFSIPWSKQSFLEELANENAYYYCAVLCENGCSVLSGYAGYWKIFDEGHITNIAVNPDMRRMGIGSKLLDYIMEKAAEQGIAAMTLEVRKSNYAAKVLYKNKGFIEKGLRKGYYEDNGEDAVIMWKEL